MARTTRQIKKDAANDYVSAKVTKKPKDKKLVVNPVNIKNDAAGSGRKKRLLRNPVKAENASGSSLTKPKQLKRSELRKLVVRRKIKQDLEFQLSVIILVL